MMTRDEIKDKLYSLHKASFKNLKQIKESTTCGCFSCGTIFKYEDILERRSSMTQVIIDDLSKIKKEYSRLESYNLW